MNRRTFILLLSIFIVLPTISFISAIAIGEDLHLNIQTTNSAGSVVTGAFNFAFNISTSGDCANVVYSNYTNLTTDSRGIVSYYLNNVTLDFSQQYWLCYYRDGTLINASKIARTPYSFTAKNMSAEGVIDDSNLNLSTHNVTASYGLFSWLGSIVSRITGLFVQNIDFSGTINGTGSINITGNITGDWFKGKVNWTSVQNFPTSELNVNSSDYWDNLNTPSDIAESVFWYNQSDATFNMFNATWDNQWVNPFNNTWYNHTIAANKTIFETYDSRWSSTFNQTYHDYWTANYTNNSNFLDGYDSSYFMPLNTSVSGNFDFNGGWQGGGLSIVGGNLFAQVGYFYNISSLQVNNLNINGSLIPTFDNQFNIGNFSLRWKDIYLSGNLIANDANLAWANLSGYPTACGTDETITAIGDTITCSKISVYNSTYNTWAYNQTTPAVAQLNNTYGSTWYNQTIGLYSVFEKFWFNQTIGLYSLFEKFWYNQSDATFNMFNATWDNQWVNPFNNTWYNHTIAANKTIFETYDSRWSSTYNATYDSYNINISYGYSGWNLTGLNISTGAQNYKVGIGARFPIASLEVNSSNTQGAFWIYNTSNRNLFFVNGSSGNVGIGTASPQTTLELKGSFRINASDILVPPTTGKGIEMYYRTDAGNDYALIQAYDRDGAGAYKNIQIYGANMSFMNGNVGIGTTSPGNKLHVVTGTAHSLTGGDTLKVEVNGLGGVGLISSIGFQGTQTNLQSARFAAIGAAFESDWGGSLRFYTKDDTASQGDTVIERMRIDMNGNVGIGTTSPGALLHVSGQDKSIVFTDTATIVSNLTLSIGSNSFGATNPGMEFDTQVASGNNMGYIFNVAGLPKVAFDKDGNVGINTTTPAYPLDINVSSGVGMRLTSPGVGGPHILLNAMNPTASNRYAQITYQSGSADQWSAGLRQGDGKYYIRDEVGGVDRMIVQNVTGNVGIGTTSPTHKLNVLGTTNFTGNSLVRGNLSVSMLAGENFTAGTLFANNTNVGIGTTSPTLGKLQVTQSSDVVTGGIAITDTAVNDAGYIWSDGTDLRIDASTDATNDIILNGIGIGKVGIGTATPGAKLDVYNTGASSYLRVSGDVAQQQGLEFFDSAQRWVIYKPASTTDLRFYSGGDRVTLQAGGNVGIGTASPTHKLNVLGTTNFTGNSLVRGNLSVSMLAGENFTAGTLFANNTNVGIGTTAPVAKLEVARDCSGVQCSVIDVKQDSAGSDITSAFTSDINFFNWDSNTRMTTPQARIGIVGDSVANQDYEAEGNLVFYTNIRNYASPVLTERMRIDSSGNVGIGTASPAGTLEIAKQTGKHELNVSGLLYVNSTSRNVGIGTTSPNANLEVYGTSGDTMILNKSNTEPTLKFAGDAGNAFVLTIVGTDFRVASNDGATSLLEIQQGGNVGIGTTAPSQKFQVVTGTDDNVSIRDRSGNPALYIEGSGGYKGFVDMAVADMEVVNEGAGKLGFGTDNSIDMSIITGGNVGIGTTSPGAKLESYSSAATIQELLRLNNPQAAGAGVRIGFNQGATQYGKIDVLYDTSWHMRIGAGDTVTDTLTIRSGNVGIGTTGPLSKLSINGGLHVGGDSDAGDNNLLVDGTATIASMTTAGFVKNAVTTGLLSGGNSLVVADVPVMTSAEFATKISDETGSGKLVFATSPTIEGTLAFTGTLGAGASTTVDLRGATDTMTDSFQTEVAAAGTTCTISCGGGHCLFAQPSGGAAGDKITTCSDTTNDRNCWCWGLI